jgi:hypothetical protein
MSTQFVASPDIYHNGCAPSWVGNTVLNIATGQVRDSTNNWDITVASTISISSAVNGANGLDTGTIAVSTGYYVFVIFDPSNNLLPAGLISLSGTAPVMPSVNGVTYGAFRLVGFVKTDGSANFLKFYADKGNDNTILIQWDAPIVVLNAGTSGTAADIDMSVAMPSVNYGTVIVRANYTPHAAAETASIKPKAATAYTYVYSGIVASVVQSNSFEILPSTSSGKPTLTYILSSATSPAALTLTVPSFHMHL